MLRFNSSHDTDAAGVNRYINYSIPNTPVKRKKALTLVDTDFLSFDWCVGNGLIDVFTQSGSAYSCESLQFITTPQVFSAEDLVSCTGV